MLTAQTEAELGDLFVTALARELRPSDRVFVGANQIEVALAAYLARRTHAPKLRIWAAGSMMLDPSLDLELVGRRSYSPAVVAARGSNFRHANAFEDVRRAVMFAGGLQVDGRGNANLVGIPDRLGGWRLRGPGTAGLASMTALSSRFYLLAPRHDPRVLVELCDALSVIGDPATRAELGLPPDALAALITPLATFVPGPDGLQMTEISPGVQRTTVVQRTGFPVVDGPAVTIRPELTAPEATALAALRAAAARNAP